MRRVGYDEDCTMTSDKYFEMMSEIIFPRICHYYRGSKGVTVQQECRMARVLTLASRSSSV